MKKEENDEFENDESKNDGLYGEEESECESSDTRVEIPPLSPPVAPFSIEPTLVPILEWWQYLIM